MNTRKYLTAPQVRERYGVSDMTLWRWLKDEELGFPKPLVIRQRRMFNIEELDAFDARLRGEAA